MFQWSVIWMVVENVDFYHFEPSVGSLTAAFCLSGLNYSSTHRNPPPRWKSSSIFQRIERASSSRQPPVPDDIMACHSRRSRAQPSGTCEIRSSFHTSSTPLLANGHVAV